MTGDLDRYLRIRSEMRPQLDAITRAFERIDMSGFEAAMRQMQRQQVEVVQALSLAGKFTPHEDLLNATRRLHELTLYEIPKADVFDRIHHSWISQLDRVTHSFAELERVEPVERIAKLALSDISHGLAVEAPLLPKIDFDILHKRLNIHRSVMTEVQHSMSRLTAYFCDLTESFPSIDKVLEAPSFVLPGATNELYASRFALDVLHPSEDEMEREVVHLGSDLIAGDDSGQSGLIALLERAGPEFVSMYEGAIEALNGDNPDRSRHVLTSLRSLWDHVLRKFAPIQEVMKWITDYGEEAYLHDGNPTRRAKVNYMLREAKNDPLMEFIEADTDAMVKLYDLYNRLHGLEAGVTDQQLRIITLRTESYLTYILRVREW